MPIRIGTRSSNLAIWQAETVASALNKAGIETEIVQFKSMGDRSLGGNLSATVGQFIHLIDQKLNEGLVDIAVHSSKDVPTTPNDAITNLAYMERGSTNDLILFKRKSDDSSLYEVLDGDTNTSLTDLLEHIEHGSTFGTVSGRRQSLLLSQRPDLIPLSVRGHVETRIERLIEGRVDALILAEAGICRLRTTGVLDEHNEHLTAYRISSGDWPTAPGQGTVCIHCKTDRFEELSDLRKILNHAQTEANVIRERTILDMSGGGCLYPAGIEARGEHLMVRIAPKNWRTTFCAGLEYSIFSYNGAFEDFELQLPQDETPAETVMVDGPKFISTLNSDRISTVLANQGIGMTNLSVIDLKPNLDAWPRDFLGQYTSKRQWPYLILTSPFSARCAILAAESNPDIARIKWVAIGEGTARACFQRGVTVAICAKARNSKEFFDYISSNIATNTKLLLPRSSVAPETFAAQLKDAGYDVLDWIGYENKAKKVEPT
ncbi:MAG: hydroxymethylbilane synthase, partial [Candidatus Thermoplasmatota archaeon]|nr:hydroxymethylbilane synthase [Candidatus Thermoplasmatota archaeon]